MAKAITQQDFQKEVLESDVPVLVDFWAEWCGPCRQLGPIIEQVSEKTDGKAKVYKLNVDENQAIAQQYGITAIPTVLVFQGGEIKHQLVGVRPEKAYLDALN